MLLSVTVSDIEEIRLGQKTTTFDAHRKTAAPFEVLFDSLLFSTLNYDRY
jgi:hypothetical protein